eukprot:scaffold5545_cov111-Isochrysis_galbana.AAC.3
MWHLRLQRIDQGTHDVGALWFIVSHWRGEPVEPLPFTSSPHSCSGHHHRSGSRHHPHASQETVPPSTVQCRTPHCHYNIGTTDGRWQTGVGIIAYQLYNSCRGSRPLESREGRWRGIGESAASQSQSIGGSASARQRRRVASVLATFRRAACLQPPQTAPQARLMHNA